MVRFVDPSPSSVEGNADFRLSPPPTTKALRAGWIYLRWRSFLSGPRLQLGLALSMIVLVSLVCWVGVLAALFSVLKRV